jgi:hypothetical protein
VYTRDLYWCCHLAQQHYPQLQQQLAWGAPQQAQQQRQQQRWAEQLDQALQMYVDLQASLQQWQQAGGSVQPGQQQAQHHGRSPTSSSRQQQLELELHMQQTAVQAWQLVDALLPQLGS